MKRIHVLPALAATLAVTALPAAAQAQENADPNAKASFTVIKAGFKKATLKVTYNCNAGDALWVSAKQSRTGRKRRSLTREGASRIARAWWQSHRNPFTCDSAEHTATFTIDKVEPGSKGRLRRGYAWVQFCVTQGEETLVLSASKWVKVRRR